MSSDISLPGAIIIDTENKVEVTQAEEARPNWRCFHCGDVFTDERCARLHFGRDENSEAACIIKAGAEGSLLKALRDAEEQADDAIQAMHNESTDAAKAYHNQRTRHHSALIVAEELGYERGLADGRVLTPTPTSDSLASPARQAIEPLLIYHETGGHEGDGGDERIALIRSVLLFPASPGMDREEIARIIDPDAFALADDIAAGKPATEYAIKRAKLMTDRALAKADAILSRLPPVIQSEREKRLEEALRTFGNHSQSCASRGDYVYTDARTRHRQPCDCGYVAALSSSRGAER